MSKRTLNRAFSQAQYRGKERRPVRPKPLLPQTDNADVVEDIISAARREDFLNVLDLPKPSVDELGQPVWPYDTQHITRQYRQRCLLVHPDKNPGERARQAFHFVNQSYKALLNPDKRSEILKVASEEALAEKEKQEASATVDERIQLNAQKKLQKRKLTKLQHEEFSSEIVRQMRERQLSHSMKRHKMAASRYSEAEEKSGTAEVGPPAATTGEEAADAWPAAVLSKSKPVRRRPRFMF